MNLKNNAGTLILIVFFFLCLKPTLADTFVHGNIESEIWTEAGSPYIVEDTLNVLAGFTLKIRPGVEVYTKPGFPINIYGSIICEGTESKPVLLSGFNHTDKWDGLRIRPEGNCDLKYTIIEYAGTVRENSIHGGGISGMNGTIKMDHCTIRYNHAKVDGGGLYLLKSKYSITNCIFHDNKCERVGSAVDFATYNELTGDFAYNIFYNNHAGASGAIYVADSYITIDHSTFYNNTAGQYNGAGDIRIYYGMMVVVTNSIFWRDKDHEEKSIDIEGGEIIATYCLSDENNLFGESLINSDPQFQDPANLDFRLRPNSICIDAGDPYFPHDEDGTITDLGAAGISVPDNRQIRYPDIEANTLLLPEVSVLKGYHYVIPVLCGPISIADDLLSIQGKLILPSKYEVSIDSICLIHEGSLERNWLFDYAIANDTLNFSLIGSECFLGSEPLFQIGLSVLNSCNKKELSLDIIGLSTNIDRQISIKNGKISVCNFLLGDVNMDNSIQAHDASLLMNYLENNNTLEQIQLQLGDVSGDGEITPYDVKLIIQKANGKIENFPSECSN